MTKLLNTELILKVLLLYSSFELSAGLSLWIKNCGIIPTENNVKILGKSKGEKLLSLEALFIHRLKPALNSKDEYKSRTLKLRF